MVVADASKKTVLESAVGFKVVAMAFLVLVHHVVKDKAVVVEDKVVVVKTVAVVLVHVVKFNNNNAKAATANKEVWDVEVGICCVVEPKAKAVVLNDVVPNHRGVVRVVSVEVVVGGAHKPARTDRQSKPSWIVPRPMLMVLLQ